MLHHFSFNPQNENTATNVKIQLNEAKVIAALDSGAAKTMINTSIAKSLKLKSIKPGSKDTKSISANGGELISKGNAYVDISLGDYSFNQKCEVIENLTAQVLLSTDMLLSQGAIIDYKNKRLVIGGTIVPLLVYGRQKEACLSINKEIDIDPNVQKLLWIDLPFKTNKPIFVEAIDKTVDCRVPDYVTSCNNGKVPIFVANKNPFTVKINPKTVIAHIEEIDRDIEVPWKSGNYEKVDVKNLVNWSKSKLTKSQKKRLLKLIEKYKDVFSKGEGDIGYCDKFKFKIDSGDSKPIKQRAYRVPYSKQDQIDKMVGDMLKQGVVSKSKSPWASPVVLVKKKDGSERFCIDFRKLNSVTVKDSYPLPLIEETIDKIRNAKFYSSMDLISGYWQMALDDESKKKTAFITHKGLYQFEVIPFALSNAGAAFQRNMEIILADLDNFDLHRRHFSI